MAFVPNLKYKTELCNAWKEGKECEKGERCFFAHGNLQLKIIEQANQFLLLLDIFCQNHSKNQQQIAKRNQQISDEEKKTGNYKTIYCKFYADGDCKLGDSCTFAHGKKDKRKKKHLNSSLDERKMKEQEWENYRRLNYYQVAAYQMYNYPYSPVLPIYSSYMHQQQFLPAMEYSEQNCEYNESQMKQVYQQIQGLDINEASTIHETSTIHDQEQKSDHIVNQISINESCESVKTEASGEKEQRLSQSI